MNTSELKQTLVARACSYELAQAIADEIDRLRAELAEARRQLKEASEQEPVGYLCDDGYMLPHKPGCKYSGQKLYAAPVPAQPELCMPVWREMWTGSGSNSNGDSMCRGSHIYAYETHLKTHGNHVVWLGESPEAHDAAAKICREHNATMALVSYPDPSVIGHLGCHPVPAQPAAESTCAWSENDDGFYETECGNAFQFIDGGAADNHATYCQYCGKKIDEHWFDDMPEGDAK